MTCSLSDFAGYGNAVFIYDVREAPAQDDARFELRITVRGKRITTSVNDKVLVDYVEPDDVERPRDMAGRVLSRGTYALQCHDPGSEVHYMDLRVKVLAEDTPAPAPAPVKNQATDKGDKDK